MDAGYHKKLWIKVSIIMVCFAVLPLFVVGITIYSYLNAAYEKIVTGALQSSTLGTRDAIETFINEQVSQLATIAGTHPMDLLKTETYLYSVLYSLKGPSNFFSALEIADSRGNRIQYAGPQDDTSGPFKYVNGDWYSAVLSSGFYISDVFDDHRNVPHFFVAVAGPGESRWILRALIEANAVDRIVHSAQSGGNGYAFIVNKNNLLQTTPRFGDKRLEQPRGLDFSSLTNAKVTQALYRGEDSFVAVTRIQNLDWMLVVIENRQEQMAPLLNARYVQGLIVICGTLLILGGTIVTVRSVIRRYDLLAGQKISRNDAGVQSGKMVALGRMAAGIAHEVNNPLAIIGGVAGWMKDLLDEQDVRKSNNFETYRDCITKIESEVRRCRTVTHRLLSFGRGIAPDRETVDVNRLMVEVVSLLESEAYFRGIGIHATYGKDLPQITTDPSRLQQVFFDIFNESIDAVGGSGSIDVNTSYAADSNEFLITISRTRSSASLMKPGDKIDGALAVNASQTRATKEFSAGYSILGNLGGKISVTEPVAGHTRFTITLPIQAPARQISDGKQIPPKLGEAGSHS